MANAACGRRLRLRNAWKFHCERKGRRLEPLKLPFEEAHERPELFRMFTMCNMQTMGIVCDGQSILSLMLLAGDQWPSRARFDRSMSGLNILNMCMEFQMGQQLRLKARRSIWPKQCLVDARAPLGRTDFICQVVDSGKRTSI